MLGFVKVFLGAFTAAVGGFGFLKADKVVTVEGPGTGGSSITPSSKISYLLHFSFHCLSLA